MAMKDFDFKKFLLQKGERVGLWVAAGLMGLFLLVSMVKAFTTSSATTNAKEITELSTQKLGQIRSATPPAGYDQAEKELLATNDDKALDPRLIRVPGDM